MPSASMKVLLPTPGHAGDADAEGAAGVRQQGVQELCGQIGVGLEARSRPA